MASPSPSPETKSVRYGSIIIAQAPHSSLFGKKKMWREKKESARKVFGFDMQKLSRTIKRNHIKYVLGALTHENLRN